MRVPHGGNHCTDHNFVYSLYTKLCKNVYNVYTKLQKYMYTLGQWSYYRGRCI